MARKGIMRRREQGPPVDFEQSPQRYRYTFTPFVIYHDVTIALNLKNTEVKRLAAEIARLTCESKTEAIPDAL